MTKLEFIDRINDILIGLNIALSGVYDELMSSQWIPVEEFPKVDISCTLLVHYVDGTIDICDYYGDFYDYTGENVTRNVTHWMPLPEAPKKGGDK